MPGIDGFTTCERLKSDPVTRDIPVIFVTARAEMDSLAKGFSVGGIDYITKPIKETEVLTRVKTQIELQKSKKEMLSLLHEKETIARYNDLLLSSVADGIFSLNEDGVITFANPACETLMGWDKGELVEQSFMDLMDYTEGGPVSWQGHELFLSCSMGKLYRDDDARFSRKDGHIYTAEYSASPLMSADNIFNGAVVIFRDVTEEHVWTDKIEHQATHDALTGLINRLEFETQLTRLLERSSTGMEEHVMMYMDLDQFKVVNDTCGHGAGDELLRQLTSRILGMVRDGDVLARLGGDEFGILLSNCSIGSGVRAANDILQSVQSFKFGWESKAFSVGASIGLVQITGNCDSISEVMSWADTACYAAKDGGRNRIHIYDDGDQELQKRQGEMQWVSKINQAIEDDSFVIHQQKIMPITAQEDTRDHFEVLIRMEGEAGELVPPGAFLPAAERYNLITNVDQWVVTALFNWLSTNEHKDNILCSVNLSGNTIGSEPFIQFLEESFIKYDVDPRSICFEITETAAVSSLSTASTFITTLRDKGCMFALDDFGTGLSSYGYLKDLPVDFLKIDGIFVKGIVDDPIDYAMVKSINEIGHVMGKKTIAEFVEDDRILRKLHEIGVDYAQGYGVGKPRAMD
ncbi:MAG: EAL domain-containing protein [Methylococcales bacterium]|nr:EAL domain-containing protein [Methylococcales bacterium]MBT7444710.1 EAL domain-containing protein [Methylococcales bacterium]